MGKNDFTLQTSEVNFQEEKHLINNIIKKLEAHNSQEVRYYYSLLKNVNAIERNIEAFNDAALLLWVGGVFVSLYKMKNENSNGYDAFLPENEEPLPLNQEDAKILNISTYFQNHSIQDAADNFFIAVDNLYSGAYRLKSAVPQFYNFKPKGVSYVRNNILEHPSHKFKWAIKNTMMSMEHAPIIEFSAIPLSDTIVKQDKLIVDIESDFTQYKGDLNRRLSSILQELDANSST